MATHQTHAHTHKTHTALDQVLTEMKGLTRRIMGEAQLLSNTWRSVNQPPGREQP